MVSSRVWGKASSGEFAVITFGRGPLVNNGSSAVTKPVVGVFDLASNVSEGSFYP